MLLDILYHIAMVFFFLLVLAFIIGMGVYMVSIALILIDDYKEEKRKKKDGH